MVTRKALGVVAILILVVAVAAWSKLRFVDAEDHAPQRWKVEEYPDARLRG